MVKDGHKKPIIEDVVISTDLDNQPQFIGQDFDDSIDSKRYNVYFERALKCPCSVKGANAPLSSCKNCGGTSWIFVNKVKMGMVIQSINRETKFKSWSEMDRGTVSISTKGERRLAFMDRITLLDIQSTFSQIIRARKYKGNYFSFLFYQPINIEDVYLFDTDKKPLKRLNLNTDYTIVENKIILSSSLNRYVDEDEKVITMTVRYTHFPVYNVLEAVRERSKNRTTDGVGDLQVIPANFIARKTHFIMEPPNFDGDSVFDNTDYSGATVDEIDPFSLRYFIRRSSAQQIYDELVLENNTTKITNLTDLLNG